MVAPPGIVSSSQIGKRRKRVRQSDLPSYQLNNSFPWDYWQPTQQTSKLYLISHTNHFAFLAEHIDALNGKHGFISKELISRSICCILFNIGPASNPSMVFYCSKSKSTILRVAVMDWIVPSPRSPFIYWNPNPIRINCGKNIFKLGSIQSSREKEAPKRKDFLWAEERRNKETILCKNAYWLLEVYFKELQGRLPNKCWSGNS